MARRAARSQAVGVNLVAKRPKASFTDRTFDLVVLLTRYLSAAL
jgi:hypothetical protein